MQTTAPACPVDEQPTERLPASEGGTVDPADRPDPLLAAYELEALWGSDESGGMYRGKVLATGTTVSIRLIRPDLSADEGYALAFEQQAERCCQLATHRVAKILDRGRTVDGRLFLVTEYIHGRSLRQLIDDGEPFDWVRVREITLQLLEGLAEGHRAGLVHWDLRPEVIWFEAAPGGDPNVRITGFGLPWWRARGPDPQAGIRPSAYAAPQRFTGGVLEERSDLYALGACLFHLLTGKPPFAGEAAPEFARERRTGNRPHISVQREGAPKGIPVEFLHLVHALMAWSPADRPRNADAVTRILTSLPEAPDDGAGSDEPPFGDAGSPIGTDVVAPARARAPREPNLLDRVLSDKRARWSATALLVLAILALLALIVLTPGTAPPSG